MTSGNRHTPTTRRARRVRTRARGATALGLAAVALVAFGGYILFMDGPSDAAGAVIPPGPAPSAPTIPDNARDLARLVEALRPLQHPLAEPGPHDWLTHHDEPGQSFEE